MLTSHLRAALTVVSAIVGLYVHANVQAEQLSALSYPATGIQQASYEADPYYYPDYQPNQVATSAGPAYSVACCGNGYTDNCAYSAGYASTDCSGVAGCCDSSLYCDAPLCGVNVYGEVQFIFMRAHVREGGLGPANSKLSEQYELSPRLVLGAENAYGNGVRARYWHYEHGMNDIANPGGFRFEFDVLDLEVYHRFHGSRTDFTLSGGFRTGHISVDYNAGWDDITSLGLTFSASGETLICCGDCHYWSVVYGARLSILGGNWTGTGTTIPNSRDDNLTVTEIDFAYEYGRQVGCSNLYCRLGVELQNWDSDNLSAGTNTDSIGFFGPSMQFGASF